MTTSISLKLLETSSSEIAKLNYFNSRFTTYIPDFFFIFLFVSVFLMSALMDRILILMIFMNWKTPVIGFLFFASSLAPFIHSLLVEKDFTEIPECSLKQWLKVLYRLLLIISGLDSAVMGVKILVELFVFKKNLSNISNMNSLPFFHISDENISLIKFYCCIISEFKSIPQLFIACIFLLMKNNKGFIGEVALATLFLNMVIFSFTIAVTLPIRKTPRTFRSCTGVLLNSFTKFMATMCACGMNLTIFAIIFNHVGYSALIIHFMRMFWSVWPCWHVLKTEALTIPILYLLFYVIFFAVIFSFIYIHPFEGKGKLFYYIINLVNFIYEIASIYLLTNIKYDIVIIYSSLRFLIIGFVTCFGLVNILQINKN